MHLKDFLNAQFLAEMFNIKSAPGYDFEISTKEEMPAMFALAWQATFTADNDVEYAFRVFRAREYGKNSRRLVFMRRKSRNLSQNVTIDQGTFKKVIVTFLRCYEAYKETADGQKCSSVAISMQPGVVKHAGLFLRAIRRAFKAEKRKQLNLVGVNEEGLKGNVELMFTVTQSPYPYWGGKEYDEEAFTNNPTYKRLAKIKDAPEPKAGSLDVADPIGSGSDYVTSAPAPVVIDPMNNPDAFTPELFERLHFAKGRDDLDAILKEVKVHRRYLQREWKTLRDQFYNRPDLDALLARTVLDDWNEGIGFYFKRVDLDNAMLVELAIANRTGVEPSNIDQLVDHVSAMTSSDTSLDPSFEVKTFRDRVYDEMLNSILGTTPSSDLYAVAKSITGRLAGKPGMRLENLVSHIDDKSDKITSKDNIKIATFLVAIDAISSSDYVTRLKDHDSSIVVDQIPGGKYAIRDYSNLFPGSEQYIDNLLKSSLAVILTKGIVFGGASVDIDVDILPLVNMLMTRSLAAFRDELRKIGDMGGNAADGVVDRVVAGYFDTISTGSFLDGVKATKDLFNWMTPTVYGNKLYNEFYSKFRVGAVTYLESNMDDPDFNSSISSNRYDNWTDILKQFFKEHPQKFYQVAAKTGLVVAFRDYVDVPPTDPDTFFLEYAKTLKSINANSPAAALRAIYDATNRDVYKMIGKKGLDGLLDLFPEQVRGIAISAYTAGSQHIVDLLDEKYELDDIVSILKQDDRVSQYRDAQLIIIELYKKNGVPLELMYVKDIVDRSFGSSIGKVVEAVGVDQMAELIKDAPYTMARTMQLNGSICFVMKHLPAETVDLLFRSMDTSMRLAYPDYMIMNLDDSDVLDKLSTKALSTLIKSAAAYADESRYRYSPKSDIEPYEKSFGRLVIELYKRDASSAEEMFESLPKDMKRAVSRAAVDLEYMSKVKDHIAGDSTPIKPLVPLTPARITQILKYNDLKVPRAPQVRDGVTLERIISRVPSVEDIGELQVVADNKTEKEMEEMSIEYDAFNKYRHGSIGVRFVRSFTVSLPNQEEGFEEFLKTYRETHNEETKIMRPVFHGTGSVAASMILRFGFRVIKAGDSSVVGRMLGDGIYFSNVIDKVAQYVSDGGFTRGRGTRGYMFEMQAALGKYGTDFSAAGPGTGYNEGGVISPEWCVFDANRQLKIYKAYEVEIVDKSDIEMLKSKHNMNESKSVVGIKHFRGFLAERGIVDMDKKRGTLVYIFVDGTIPVSNNKAVDFAEFDPSKFGKHVRLEKSGNGPTVEIKVDGPDGIFAVRHTHDFMKDEEEFEKFMSALRG